MGWGNRVDSETIDGTGPAGNQTTPTRWDVDPADAAADAALRADIRRLGALLGADPFPAGRPGTAATWSRRSGPWCAPRPRRRRRVGRTRRGASPRSTWQQPPAWPGRSPRTSISPTSPSRCTGRVSCGGPRGGRWLAGAHRRADRSQWPTCRGDRRGRAPPCGPTGLHRPPDRGGPPVDPDQAPEHRRRAGRGDQAAALAGGTVTAADRARTDRHLAELHRPAVADRRAAATPPRPDATRPATRSTTCADLAHGRSRRRCSTTSPRPCGSSAWSCPRRPGR